jgi:cytidine deaminase
MSNPLSPEERQQLCQAAQEAAKLAYAPYSKFRVGAAILTGAGAIYTGVNVENASYGLTLCAERTAFAKAVSEGQRNFRAVAVACIDGVGVADNIQEFMPCGACRQWMVEFAKDAEIIICGVERVFRVDELMPIAFRLGKP